MIKINGLLLLASLLLLPLSATAASSSEISEIKRELMALKKQLAALEQALEKAQAQEQTDKVVKADKTAAKAAVAASNIEPKAEPKVTASKDKGEVKVYASLRPTFGRIDDHSDTFNDVQDALSNAGFKSTYEFKPGWKAIMHGEWSVDIANNGDFGRSRQVYVGLSTPYGQVAIGKQRPVHYTLIAEYVDIFNHRSSPFAYDVEGPFFVDNLVTYENTFNNFKFMLASQFNGSSGDDNSDFFNTGLAYDKDGLHLAVAYSTKGAFDQDDMKLGDTDVTSVSIAKEFESGLYAAAAYQSVDYDFAQQRDGYTFDASFGYRFAPE